MTEEYSLKNSSIQAIATSIGEWIKHHRDTLWRVMVLVLIAWSGYNLGLVRAHRGTLPAQVAPLLRVRDSVVSQTIAPQGEGSPATPKPDHSDPRVVVSKGSSSKKYHYIWCSSGQRIKEANRLWFPTAQAAQAAGYTLAGNCTN